MVRGGGGQPQIHVTLYFIPNLLHIFKMEIRYLLGITDKSQMSLPSIDNAYQQQDLM